MRVFYHIYRFFHTNGNGPPLATSICQNLTLPTIGPPLATIMLKLTTMHLSILPKAACRSVTPWFYKKRTFFGEVFAEGSPPERHSQVFKVSGQKRLKNESSQNEFAYSGKS